jgi:hypothetical protein
MESNLVQVDDEDEEEIDEDGVVTDDAASSSPSESDVDLGLVFFFLRNCIGCFK